MIGAEAAARKVFGKDVDQLDLQEAAFIGAMLACPAPARRLAKVASEVQRRAAYGLSLFANGKRLTRRYNLTFRKTPHSRESARQPRHMPLRLSIPA